MVRVEPLREAFLIDSSTALGMTESYPTANDIFKVTLSSRACRGICLISIRGSGFHIETPFRGKLKPCPLGMVVHDTLAVFGDSLQGPFKAEIPIIFTLFEMELRELLISSASEIAFH